MKNKNMKKKQVKETSETFKDIMSRSERKKYEKILLEENKNINVTKENEDINLIDKKFDNSLNDIKNNDKTNNKILQNNQSHANIGINIAAIISLLISIAAFIHTILFCKNQINNIFLIINAFVITLFTLFLTISITAKNIKLKNLFGLFTTIIISCFIIFNFLVNNNILELPTQELLQNFQNQTISEALKWAKEHNIEVEQIYEYSDNIAEYHIITQDIYPNTLLKNVKKITFTVSYGPNYDKIISLPNMVGWNIDDAYKTINENFLNNVIIDYEINDEVEKDVIIEQNTSGQIRRSDEIKLTVSLGKEDELESVEMINLENKSILEATLWLKRHGIKYELIYIFSDDIPKKYVVTQETKVGENIDPKNDKVTLIISKGKKIIVPDLTKMSVEQATEWIISNNLKVKFDTKYDSSIEVGKIIEADYKENDEIEDGTLITIITSKGPLKMPKFNNISELRTWANNNNIEYREEYEFNNDISKGEIIKTIPESDSVINYSDTIIVHISYGKPVTIPSFIGKSRNEIEKECNNIGLNCTFYYNGYSDTPYNIAQNQNKNVGSEVVQGTYVSIGLSSGPKPAEEQKTEPPACDKSKTTTVWITPGNDGNQTKIALEKQYSNIKWKFDMVDKCLNGDSTAGAVCNASSIDGQALNSCDEYTVTIVK